MAMRKRLVETGVSWQYFAICCTTELDLNRKLQEVEEEEEHSQ